LTSALKTEKYFKKNVFIK